jgi:hypothetical protein
MAGTKYSRTLDSHAKLTNTTVHDSMYLCGKWEGLMGFGSDRPKIMSCDDMFTFAQGPAHQWEGELAKSVRELMTMITAPLIVADDCGNVRQKLANIHSALRDIEQDNVKPSAAINRVVYPATPTNQIDDDTLLITPPTEQTADASTNELSPAFEDNDTISMSTSENKPHDAGFSNTSLPDPEERDELGGLRVPASDTFGSSSPYKGFLLTDKSSTNQYGTSSKGNRNCNIFHLKTSFLVLLLGKSKAVDIDIDQDSGVSYYVSNLPLFRDATR